MISYVWLAVPLITAGRNTTENTAQGKFPWECPRTTLAHCISWSSMPCLTQENYRNHVVTILSLSNLNFLYPYSRDEVRGP